MLGLLWPNQSIRAKEGESIVDRAVFSCHVMLMLLEMDARLDRHLGIMKRTVLIQIKILVNPSLCSPLINTTFCIDNNDVIHWELCLFQIISHPVCFYNLKNKF